MHLLARLWCGLMGHQFYVLQQFGQISRRVCCDHCGGDWGMNDDALALIRWSSELEAMYISFGHRVLKR